MTIGQTLDFQQKHKSDYFGRHFVAGSASMRHNQVFLQSAQVVIGN